MQRRILLALVLLAVAVVFWMLGAPKPPATVKPVTDMPPAKPAAQASPFSPLESAPAIPGAPAPATTVKATMTAEAATPFSPAQLAALLGLEPHLDADDDTLDAALRPLRAWAQRDPAACAAWIAHHLNGQSRMRCLEEVMGLWSTRDIPAALAWLTANVPDEGHAGSYGVVLNAWAVSDPAAAAAWLAAHPGSGAASYAGILSQWVATDPAAAGVWARQNLQAGDYAKLLPSLLLARPQGSDTGELLKGLLPSVRDDSLKTAIHAAPQGHEMQSLELAGLMTDPAARRRAQESILLRWRQTDPAAMEAYTQAHNLPQPLASTAPLLEQPQTPVSAAAPLSVPKD